jgi:membrane associated rhomboid family serine protease
MFALSVGEIIWFSLAIFFFLISWFAGGDEFQESLGGNATLAGLLAGLVLGAILCAVTKPK